jgi:hypothetical protein
MTVPSAFGLLAKTCALPLFHIEMKMIVGFIGIRPKHRAEGFARLICRASTVVANSAKTRAIDKTPGLNGRNISGLQNRASVASTPT